MKNSYWVGRHPSPISASNHKLLTGWPESGLFPLILVDIDAIAPNEIRLKLAEFPGSVIVGVTDTVSTAQFNELLNVRAVAIVSRAQLAASDMGEWVQIQEARLAWQQKFEPLIELIAQLTRKEREILMQSRIYDAAPELADAMHVSTRTVEAHRYNIIRKAARGNFREWTVQVRLAILNLERLGVNGEALLDTIPSRRRPRLLETA